MHTLSFNCLKFKLSC